MIALSSLLLLSITAATVLSQNGKLQDKLTKADDLSGKAQPKDDSTADQQTSSIGFTPQLASNYTFKSAFNPAQATNMTSGTTQLIGPDQNDVASAVTDIGFDFFFQGARFNQFSVNSDGGLRLGSTVISNVVYNDVLRNPSQSVIAAFASDQRTHAGDGKVHFKVTGSAPNRVMTVQWLNMQSDSFPGGTADLTYQLQLHETTGVFESIYDSLTISSAAADSSNLLSNNVEIGFSSDFTAGTFGFVDIGRFPPVLSTALFPVPNNRLFPGMPGAEILHRVYTYTPPTPNAPSNLTFSSLATLSYTLNWTDSSNELLYAIYRSTDGVNYTFDGTAGQNATSYSATGLLPSTTYFWRVFAVSEGAFSTALTGSQVTATPNEVTTLNKGGLWSDPSTWSSGSLPTTNDNVTIAIGATVVIDTAATALNLTINSGGLLQFEQTTARTLTIPFSLTIDSGGTFRSHPAGTQTGHNVSIGGDLTNNGVLDFSTDANLAGANITFTGATNNTFSGSGAVTDIRQITVNKGTSPASIIELTPTNFTVRGVTTDTVVGGWLVTTNGTIKISGTFSGTSRVFATAAYTIPASFGVWLNNPNYAVAGQNGSPANNGMLRVSQGTFNIGTAADNSMGFGTGSTTIVEGGAVNATGGFGVAAAGNSITYTQTAGTVTVCTIGNSSSTLGSFDLGTSLNSAIAISGGTIVTQLDATAIDYRDQAGTGINAITGGTLQLGNAASGSARTFNLSGVLPNLVITNTSAGHTATMSTTLVNYSNTSRNITINTGTTFDTGNTKLVFDGTTLTNNGTLTSNGANSNFDWDNTGSAMTYTGTGAVTVPMTNMTFDNSAGVILSSANDFQVVKINLRTGSVTNSNKLILGGGGSTTGTVEIGDPAIPTAAGTFDVLLKFALGTGGQVVSYLRTTTARTTGNELNPARILTGLTYDDNNPTHSLTITTNVNITGTTALTNGRIITGVNTLGIGGAGTVLRTNGYVDGNLRKTYTAAASKTFEVGTANGYSPVSFNATSGTFPTDVIVKAVQGPQPNQNPLTSLQRYWPITAADVTANLTFNYLNADVSSIEANYDLIEVSGGVSSRFPNGTSGVTINTGTNTASITGVSSFSDWTLAEPPRPIISGISPTSAQVGSSGQTVTIDGAEFVPTSTLLYDGASHAVTFVNNLQLTFVLSAADTASPGTKTVKIINPVSVNSNTVLFTIDPANVCSSQTTETAPGQSGRAVVLPGGCAANGIDAELSHDGAAPSDAMLYVANYMGGNPTPSPLLDVGGGFVDLKVTNATADDVVDAAFYYPSSITGSDEAALNLLVYTGGGWRLVKSSGGVDPVKFTADNQNGTVSGGVFSVTFDSTSTPKITELSGTVFTFSTISPTAVNFDLAEVTQVGNSAVIEWKTGMEVNNLGFNVYRQSGGQRIKVNPSLIAGSALMVGSDVRLQSGYTYSWQDETADRTATYWIEDVDLNGSSTWHGPFGITSSTRQLMTRTRSALLNNLSTSAVREANSVMQREYAAQTGTTTTVSSRTINAGRTPTKSTSITSSLQKQWQLANQNAVKIAINKTGWYKVNANDLLAAGLINNSGPFGLRMYLGGNEIPIKVNSADGLHFDSVEFYGVALDTATTDKQIYWLTSNLGMGKRINVQSSPGGNNNGPSSFQYTVERKDRSLYFSSLRNGDAENWFGPVINTNPVSQTVNIHNHDANAIGQAEIEIALQGVTTNAHQVTISLNGQALNTTTFDGMDHQVLKLSVPESSLIEGNNQITFAAAASGDVSLIDYVRITYAHTYTANNNWLSASVTGNQPVKIGGFTSNQITAIDVTNANQPVELEGTIDGEAGNYAISVSGAKRRNLIVFTPDNVLQPVSITANQLSSLSKANNGADFVIITSKEFAASIQPLANLRQSQGYQVKVVDVEDIYDEFDYGIHSPQAIKDFLNWTYTHWARQPQYVMLAGGGTLDPRNYTGVGYADFVPTKLIDTSSMETASDDWFVDFNNDGKPQMSIGRLPVNTSDEAVSVVNKIIAYEQSGSTQGVVLVSDLSDGIDFNGANNQIRTTIPANLLVTNIARTQNVLDAKIALMDQLNQGGRIVNYAGHGTVNQWRGGLLTNSDMTSLANHRTSPLVVTMTCLNGYFQDPKLASLGESLLKVNNGGAVSVWASSGMTDSWNQTEMNQEFFRQLFGHPGVTIGQAIKVAKSATSDNDVRRTWILLGDPTMRIKR